MRINLFFKLFFPIFLIFVFFGIVVFYTISRDIRTNKIEREKTVAADFILTQARRHLIPENFNDPDYARNKYLFDDFFDEIGTKEVVNIKIWNKYGKILYSANGEETGEIFSDNREFNRAIKNEIVAEIKTNAELAGKYKNNSESDFYKQLMEVYVPITFSNGTEAVGAVETYINMDSINGEIDLIRLDLLLIIFGSLFILLATVSIFFDLFVSKPLNIIEKAVNKINSGGCNSVENDLELNLNRNDEIGFLAKNFRLAFKSIQKSGEKIKEEHNQLKAILSSMGEGLIVLDRDLNIVLLNKTAQNILDAPLKDAQGKNIKEVLTLMKGDKDLPIEEWPARRMLKSGRPAAVNIKDDIYYKTASGKKFPVEITTAPFIKNGIAGAIVVFRDVTGLKIAEEDREYNRINLENALQNVYIERDIAQEQKNKIEAILNSIGDAVFAVDKEKKIIIFNSAAEALTGFKFSKVRGTVYNKNLKFLDEVTKKEKTKHIDRALKGESVSADRHFVLMTKKGNSIYIEERITPIKNQQKEIIGCIVVFRDITAKRKLEAMRSDFISIASHQLRTPLSATKWFLEILMNGDVGALKKKQLDITREAYINNQSMINLVNTMLSMSRIESKELAINLEKFNLENAIRQILGELEPALVKKGQRLKFYGLNDKKLELESDKVLLKNVIDNLVTNASKYSSQGTDIIVRIAGKKTDSLVFSVADRGIGIPKMEHYKIFKKFSRANNAVAYNASGTGLGLYIAKSILDVFGGKIWFKSEEGKGSVFYFSLPIKKGYCKI